MVDEQLRVGFFTGTVDAVGSGQTVVLPLASGISKQNGFTCGIQLSRLRKYQKTVEELPVYYSPLTPKIVTHFPGDVRGALQKFVPPAPGSQNAHVDFYLKITGQAINDMADELNINVLYVFHNRHVTRVLPFFPHSNRLLVINTIGFGIDPSRGGRKDTFYIQKQIFSRPYWDLHVAATQFERDQYNQVYQELGLDTRKLVYLPHSYNDHFLKLLDRDKLIRKSEYQFDGKMLLYPVNVYRRKNIEMAIAVLAKVNQEMPSHLVVTGKIWEPEYHQKLLSLAQEAGVSDRVHFFDGVPWEDLRSLYHFADAIVFTSHQETFGIGLIEAMACGCPVVGPDWIIPCKEILSQSAGGWTAPKETDEFARTVISVLNQQHDPQSIAKSVEQNFSSSSIARQFIAHVSEIRETKAHYRRKLDSIDWKGLYADEGNLL